MVLMAMVVTYTFISQETVEVQAEVEVASGIIAMIIASSIFSILKTATDTVFMSALEDLERHDGSSSKPYAMSDNMRSMLLNQ